MRGWFIASPAALCLGLAAGAGAAEPDVFHKPVRLKAAGQVIDAGEAWGHCGPTLADVDGDGKRDLVVGDFSGKFRYYRNVGTDAKPEYAALEYLRAGGEVAQVPIY
ncbi:MAG TPA: hypothetical protein VIL46_11860 [Gemmataceae bacterium]